MNQIKIETIFDLLKNKDHHGFTLLYEHYFRLMYGVAFSITGNDALSRDVIQNTMLKLYRLEKERFPKSNELTWLYTVTKNEALMILRKEKPVSDIEVLEKFPIIEKGIEDFADMDSYYSLLTSLNETQKQIITLKVLGGLSHKEIARMLNKPIGTIQWIYNTSIKTLRHGLTALSLLVISATGWAVYEGVNYLQSKEEPHFGIESVTPDTLPWYLIVSVITLLLLMTIWILFFKFSDRLPTNKAKQRI